jgi:hypothetical protein
MTLLTTVRNKLKTFKLNSWRGSIAVTSKVILSYVVSSECCKIASLYPSIMHIQEPTRVRPQSVSSL